MLESNRFGCQLRTDTFNGWIHWRSVALQQCGTRAQGRDTTLPSLSRTFHSFHHRALSPLRAPSTLFVWFSVMLGIAALPFIRDFTSAGSDPITAHFPRKLFLEKNQRLFPLDFSRIPIDLGKVGPFSRVLKEIVSLNAIIFMN